MIGYASEEILEILDMLDEKKISFVPQKPITRATFYSVLAGSMDDRSLDSEVFSYLFILYLMSKKNTYKHSMSDFRFIFNEDIVHELNRALYDQKSRKAMLMLPGVVPAFISDALKRIGNDDFIGALCNFLIYYNKDFSDFLISSERIDKMAVDKGIYKQKFTDFGELRYGADNNWA